MAQDFDGGVAIVAGGSGGIGSAICAGLARAGSNVALTYRSRKESADRVVAEVEAAGKQALAMPVDHTDLRITSPPRPSLKRNTPHIESDSSNSSGAPHRS